MSDGKRYETGDGLENLIANLGTNMDKRSHTNFVNNRGLSAGIGLGISSELDDMYRTNGLAARIIDIKPDNMCREWRRFTGDIDPDTVNILEEEETRLGVKNHFNEVDKWSRLYGTAFLLLNVDDGLAVEKPLDINNVGEGGFKGITVLDRTFINTGALNPTTDPTSPNFYMPEHYKLIDCGNLNIHHSRLLRFDGVKIPKRQLRHQGYMSDSVLDRIYDTLLNFGIASDSAAGLVFESNVDIFKIKGLMNLLQTADGEDLVRKRIALTSSSKSNNNALLMDAEEDFHTKTNTFSGVADLIFKFGEIITALSETPHSILFGKSSSALGNTNDGDLDIYYDNIRAAQERVYRPKLNIIDQLMVRNLGLNPDDDYSFEFNSLYQMSDAEKADIELKNAQRDQIYYDRSIVTGSQIAGELKQSSTYTNITDDDIEEMRKDEESDDVEIDADTEEFSTRIGEEVETGEEAQS